jgi:cyclopropane fatty-acyl-phospholipid synthase-like methyltransferase
MNKLIPWYLKILLKIILARLPVNIHRFWRNLGIFKHGDMDNSSYVINNFESLIKFGDVNKSTLNNKNLLEVGCGDSIGSAVVAASYGMSSILVDVDSFATKEIEIYKKILNEINAQRKTSLDFNGVYSFEDLLQVCKASYLTRGTSSLKDIDSSSVDFIISQACLEHVRKDEFKEFIEETYRLSKQDGLSIHSIDFKDHLSYSLNNLRFSELLWESDFMASSGFYTNRLRYSEMREIFIDAGFEIVCENISSWENLPLTTNKFNKAFKDFDENDLKVKEVVICLKKT